MYDAISEMMICILFFITLIQGPDRLISEESIEQRELYFAEDCFTFCDSLQVKCMHWQRTKQERLMSVILTREPSWDMSPPGMVGAMTLLRQSVGGSHISLLYGIS